MEDYRDDERVHIVIQPRKKITPPTKEERIALWFVVVFGFGTLIFGGLSWASAMRKPYLITYTGPRYMTTAEQEDAEVSRLRLEDSDDDGVSDYDELHIFSSSPYIADTDSDGILDGVEISAGDDPLCARGGACEKAQETVVPVTIPVDEAPEAPVQQVPTAEDALGSLQGLSTAEIRKILQESGMESSVLDQLSDEQVATLYQEALSAAAQELKQQESSPITP